MGKLITIYVMLSIIMCSIQGLAASKNSPYFLQFIPESYILHVDKSIFVLTIDDKEPYQGRCVSFGNNYVTIRTVRNKILSIPHYRIIRIWQVKE